ncbi:hypothetical protein TNCT_290351 [Trichonephila clavata]|uniref:Uncharacterized protein n=1 Tax=Trichonephila clavata TaxID=2740835 RepID=A0A8X6H9P0_TRICU|nr:hypothetical protein TNCT_290351 [Trichonephila clavata]
MNISLVNVHVTYVHNMAPKFEKALSGGKFAIKLCKDLLAPCMKKGLNVSTLPRSTRTIICELLKLEQNTEPPEQSETKTTGIIVLFCPCQLEAKELVCRPGQSHFVQYIHDPGLRSHSEDFIALNPLVRISNQAKEESFVRLHFHGLHHLKEYLYYRSSENAAAAVREFRRLKEQRRVLMSERALKGLMVKFKKIGQLGVLHGRERNRVNTAVVEDIAAEVVEASSESLRGTVSVPTISCTLDMPLQRIMRSDFILYNSLHNH